MRILAVLLAANLAIGDAKADVFSGAYAGVIGSLNFAGTTGNVSQYSGPSFSLLVVGYYPSSLNADLNDFSIGGIFGYGRTIGRLYFGLEADVSASFGNSNFQVSHPITIITTPPVAAGVYSDYTLVSKFESDWYATARGRMGVIVSDSFMLYATVGLAAVDVDAEITLSAKATSRFGHVTANTIRFGPVLGVGTDFSINQKMNLRAEYQYAWIGNLDVTTIGPHVDDLITYRYNLDRHLLRIGITSNF
ncbi:MAG: outer membrane protein [Pseudomonadota bacterium]